MRNIKITIQYNGKNYCGWQDQPNHLGVQGAVKMAYYELTKENIRLNGSGRTDAGAHALGQVANFYTQSKINSYKLPNALNTKLPKDISVIDAQEVSLDFHARYNAKNKTYKYVIYNSKYRNPIISEISYQVKYDLDLEKMLEQSKYIIGTHDFKSFMSSNTTVKDTIRTINYLEIIREKQLITITINGNGFLYNMVRIIVGTLLDIGRGKIKGNLLDIINSKNRENAGHTAPSYGLFLKEVNY